MATPRDQLLARLERCDSVPEIVAVLDTVLDPDTPVQPGTVRGCPLAVALERVGDGDIVWVQYDAAKFLRRTEWGLGVVERRRLTRLIGAFVTRVDRIDAVVAPWAQVRAHVLAEY